MEDKIWYIYQNQKQQGPFAVKEMREQYPALQHDTFLFKTGWKEWRPFEECLNELETHQERRKAVRTTVEGQIIIHDNKQLLNGRAVNISSLGLFVLTPDAVFPVGEKIKLTCKLKELSFNAVATVIRFTVNKGFPQGYGLRFDNLDPQIANDIERIIRGKR
jgi:hypothetical protein